MATGLSRGKGVHGNHVKGQLFVTCCACGLKPPKADLTISPALEKMLQLYFNKQWKMKVLASVKKKKKKKTAMDKLRGKPLQAVICRVSFFENH